MKKLLEQPSKYAARGVVRDDKSAAQLKGWGATDEQIFKGDILREDGKQVLAKAVEGTDALVSQLGSCSSCRVTGAWPVLLVMLCIRWFRAS
jgi:hypothetical protein